MNVVVVDEGAATALRKQLWAEHLECEESDLDAPVHEVVDERLLPRAEEQLHRLSRGHPPTRRLSHLPHVSRRSRGVFGPLNGLPVVG